MNSDDLRKLADWWDEEEKELRTSDNRYKFNLTNYVLVYALEELVSIATYESVKQVGAELAFHLQKHLDNMQEQDEKL